MKKFLETLYKKARYLPEKEMEDAIYSGQGKE